MGLSKESVNLAWKILNEINPEAKNSFIQKHESQEVGPENTIFGWGPKSDGGWENVFTDIRNINSDQLRIWNKKKKSIGNTPSCQNKGNGVTRIGWI